MKRLVITFTLIAVIFAFSLPLVAQEKAAAPKHEYVGAAKCAMCHKKDNIHPTWMETKHAKAWESLKPEDQKNEKCIACHSTGTDAKGTLLTGVQCEACHGPGSNYMKMNIMKDQKLAIENGLIIPTEKTCQKCHNENVPAEFKAKEPYDFAKMMTTGIHARPAKEKPAETK